MTPEELRRENFDRCAAALELFLKINDITIDGPPMTPRTTAELIAEPLKEGE